MTFDPSEFLQLLMGVLLGVIGFQIRSVLQRLDTMEVSQRINSARLVRIETKLGISDNHNDAA